MQQTIMGINIAKDIGFHEDTITDLRNVLVMHNQKLPAAHRFSQDEICETMLRPISLTSQTYGTACLAELNAVAGNPGQPQVRLYQAALAPGVAGAHPVHRCLNSITENYSSMWESSIKAGWPHPTRGQKYGWDGTFTAWPRYRAAGARKR